MKTKHLLAFVLLTLAQCSHAQEQYNFEDLKPAVIEFFKRGAGNPDSCVALKEQLAIKTKDEQLRKMMIGFCDSDIDTTKPVSFSEMSLHNSEGHPFVCGIISGQTQLGRKIGARFIAAEPYHLVLRFKYSRRPIAYSGDDEILVDEFRYQVRTFNELHAKACN
ncbi:TPA: hypothetical protein ONC26_003336 [Enterobacter roggenkampii]|nr:hypothetical protein [Enterobacter roggenkampii]